MLDPTIPIRLATAPRASELERRLAGRYLPVSGTACRVTEGRPDTLWPVRVHNLSENGIGLLVRQPFEPGTLVAMEVFNHGEARTVLGVVARCVAADSGDWILGCQFNSLLSTAELKNFCELAQQMGTSPR